MPLAKKLEISLLSGSAAGELQREAKSIHYKIWCCNDRSLQQLTNPVKTFFQIF